MSQSIKDINEQREFDRLRKQPGPCLELVRGICKEHNLPLNCTRTKDGSQLVFESGDSYIIKIFSPQFGDCFRTETIFLKQLHGQLPIHTPLLHASGYWEKYPYIIMEKLRGVLLKVVWDELSGDDRRDIVCQLGEAVRSLHSLPVQLFSEVPFHWDVFIDRQWENILDHHRGFGLREEWLSQLVGYMESFPLDIHDAGRMVPLHTELMKEHVFVRKERDRWIISGLIDFEPAMVGHVEYEFCSLGLFITRGDRDLFRLFLSSYGYSDGELDDRLSRRIMMFLLLHRYCDLEWFLEFIPSQLQLTELGQLEDYW
ncbi:MAG: phosphotransferase, partial [bacterium]|nr:phosphotransferase [bacterium]